MSDVEGLDAEQTIEVVRRGAEACERSLGQPTERELVKALVEALAQCDVCGRPALLIVKSTGGRPRRCDDHAAIQFGATTLEMVDADYAPALRALLERMRAWDAPMPGAGVRLVGDKGGQG